MTLKYPSGSIQFGSEECSASSTWKEKHYGAKAALPGATWFWCPIKNQKKSYWWISFKEKPVRIVSIEFEEQEYVGSQFEFFAAETEKATSGKLLIKGTQAEISGADFENDQSYHFYGLAVMKPKDASYASLKNFRYSILGKWRFILH